MDPLRDNPKMHIGASSRKCQLRDRSRREDNTGMDERGRYVSYMLRLWETTDGEARVWRASVECPGTGERLGFSSLHGLIEFLEAQTGHHDGRLSRRGTDCGTGGDVNSL